MRELSAAWKWTIDEKMGIFSVQSDAVAGSNERPRPLPVSQHMLLIQVTLLLINANHYRMCV